MADSYVKKRGSDVDVTPTDCSEPKKPRPDKSDNSCPVFDAFYQDEGLLTDVKYGIHAIQNWNEYSLCMLKISSCNGTGPYAFSNVSCQTERHERVMHNGLKVVRKFSFSSIFRYGEELLTCFLKPQRCLPQRKGARMALEKLLNFMSNEIKIAERAFLKKRSCESECAVILAHHLLSRLSVSSFYVLDGGYQKKPYSCPCPCGEKMSGIYGDTSIGSPQIWHGFLDIMMGVSVKLADAEPEFPDGHENHSSVEVKVVDLKTCREQIIAQSIVFSFFQKKLHPQHVIHLIPSIGISRDKVVVYFYDCNNDILLESCEMPYIIAEGSLYKPTIIALWLVLNFKYCCSGITKGMQDSDFKAGFPALVHDKLSLYKEVTAPCQSLSEKDEELWFWGMKPEHDEPALKLEDINKLGTNRKSDSM